MLEYQVTGNAVHAPGAARAWFREPAAWDREACHRLRVSYWDCELPWTATTSTANEASSDGRPSNGSIVLAGGWVLL